MDDARRVEVWMAMAEQFLDTETRPDIPGTALLCVEAGLSTGEAAAIWRDEVLPAVGFNTWQVAGEWAGWDRDWLVARIERLRHRRRGPWGWLRERLRDLGVMKGVWQSIGRSMDLLRAAPSVEARQQLCRDLAFLAGHYFDVAPRGAPPLDAAAGARVRALYPAPFQHLMQPALVSGEAAAAHRRILQALA
jgi:hypothetical protein